MLFHVTLTTEQLLLAGIPLAYLIGVFISSCFIRKFISTNEDDVLVPSVCWPITLPAGLLFCIVAAPVYLSKKLFSKGS